MRQAAATVGQRSHHECTIAAQGLEAEDRMGLPSASGGRCALLAHSHQRRTKSPQAAFVSCRSHPGPSAVAGKAGTDRYGKAVPATSTASGQAYICLNWSRKVTLPVKRHFREGDD
jgi:hypothetical protein